MPHTTRQLLGIASNHTDGEEAVTAALNTPQGKGKQVVDHGEHTSSRFKKKKKKKKHRRDDNFIAAVERKTLRPKGNPTKPAPSKDNSRGSWTQHARTTRSPSSTRSGITG
jgi:hypothetical protein